MSTPCIFARLSTILLALTFLTPHSNGAEKNGEKIDTSKGTFILRPAQVSDFTSEGNARSGLSVAEEAITALAGDITTLRAEKTKSEEEIKAYTAEMDQYNARKDAYETGLAKFREDKPVYLSDVEKHNGIARTHASEVQASNNLKPEQRDAGTVSRLNTEKGSLDSAKARLDQRKDRLNKQRDLLVSQEEELKESRERLNTRATDLNKKKDAVELKLGTAYRQLKTCHTYAVQIRELLRTKYKVSGTVGNPKLLSSADETLKELSNQGFDGNTPKKPLTEKRDSPEYFKK
jgi:chromosome segregation ATPase